MSDQDHGVPASPSGSQASPEAATASSPSVSIPNAGQWCVVRRRSYGPYWSHDFAQIDSVKAKSLYAKVGAGRRLQRFSLGDIVMCPSEKAARHLCQALDGAKGEAIRRERAAHNAYKFAIGKLYASAIEARSDATAQTGAAEGESAAREAGDAQ